MDGCGAFYTNVRQPARVENGALEQRYYLRTPTDVVSKKMTVSAAHALAAEYKQKQLPFFMAAVAEEN